MCNNLKQATEMLLLHLRGQEQWDMEYLSAKVAIHVLRQLAVWLLVLRLQVKLYCLISVFLKLNLQQGRPVNRVIDS